MQCCFLVQFLEQKEDIRGETGGVLLDKAWNLTLMHQHRLLSFDRDSIVKMLALRETG